MALVKQVKVHASTQPTPSILVEHRNVKNFLLVESNFAAEINSADANSIKQNFTKICDAYGCLGAIQLNRGSESLGYFLVLVTGCKSVGRILENDIYRVTDVSFVSIKNGTLETSSAASEMKRLLCCGSFYFLSSNVDASKNSIFITHSLQSSANEEREEYLWNRNLIAYFSIRGIRCRTWLTYIMCGGVDIRTFYGSSQQGRMAVISRLNCERVGTRYNVRGVDSQGNVANFVESEQIICIGNSYSSFIITRGSVPLYWEQPGLNVGSHKVKTPFSPDVSLQAFERHMEKIVSNYTDCVMVNLLGSKEGESYLSKCYQDQLQLSKFSNPEQSISHANVELINFDYHAQCRSGKSTNITKLMDECTSRLRHLKLCPSYLAETAVFGYLSDMAAKQLAVLGHSDNQQILSRVTEPLKAIWQYTGDLISRMYAGTGALEGKDAVGKLKDGAKSLSRSIQNNFLDQGKQETMDALLRIPFHSTDLFYLSRLMLTPQQLRRSSSVLLRDIFKHRESFCQDHPLRVCIGTWNVNGGKKIKSIADKGKTLKDWLVQDPPAKSYYQAIYEYSSNENGDLCLAMNDFVTVDYELEEGEWLHGSTTSQEEGIFPASYVQRIFNPHRVLHDFPAQQDGDLGLWTSEIVDVTEANGEWLTGTVYRDGVPEEGTFPANFVEKVGEKTTDIYAIGFEEMVELNAGNIVNASLSNQKAWATELQDTISPNKEYVLITSEQLVGVCLFVFVKRSLSKDVGEVSVATIKTGMGGAAGNKGAVAISISLYDTSFCFVCSHFAAGQTQVMERNSDFEEIHNKLFFVKISIFLKHGVHGERAVSNAKDLLGVVIHSYEPRHPVFVYHSNTGRPLMILFANLSSGRCPIRYTHLSGQPVDLELTIDMSGDEVKELIKNQDWEKLKENDQLLVQKKMKNVFKGFNEGEINFAPTYKYDLFSDDYDTSEKCRVPAWTDRVLWKRKTWLCENEQEESASNIDFGTVLLYDRTELKTSDHRPVAAVIDIPVPFTLHEERDQLFEDLIHKIQPIYPSVYIYVEGQPCNQPLCEEFIESLEIGSVNSQKVFPNAYMITYVEFWMAEEALNHDGEFFQGKRMRLSISNDNYVDKASPAMPPPQSLEEAVIEAVPIDAKFLPLRSSLPISHSSGNLKAMQQPIIKRQNSTPQLNPSLPVSATSSPKVSKKPPPRPPAISNPPPRPPALNSYVKPGAPETPSPVIEQPPPSMVQSSPTHSLNGFKTEVKPTSAASQDYSFPDLSNWRNSFEPPKIKPRKTVPKRRAPVPPNASSQMEKAAAPILSSPLVPTRTTASLPPAMSGILLDEAFGSASSTPLAPLHAPLVPLQPSPVNSTISSNAFSLLSSFDPLTSSSSLKPQRPARAAPIAPPPKSKPPLPLPVSLDPFGDLLSSSKSNSRDPWSSGGTVSQTEGKMNKSFTTDFSDFLE